MRNGNGHYVPAPQQTSAGFNHSQRHPPPYEGSSTNGFGSPNKRPPGSSSGPSYYYSSSSSSPATGAPSSSSPAEQSPSNGRTSYKTTTTTIKSSGSNGKIMTEPGFPSHPPPRTSTLPPNSGSRRGQIYEMDAPSYQVEHLASFAVGRQFGLLSPSDGVKKLKQMERNSAIWAQPMQLKLYPDKVNVEEENGDLVEQFPMDLIVDPTAHNSSDPQDMFNNVLLFVVQEDTRNGKANFVPTEMHIFQCVRVPSQDVAQDLHYYIKGQYQRVRGGMRDGHPIPGGGMSPPAAPRGQYRDDISTASNSTEYFEMDVNTLNRCFDDIERFVARIQSAAIAQRELEMHQHRMRSQQRSKRTAREAAAAAQHGILQLRAQMPSYNEFFEVFQKFKLSFNLLAKLKNHIHEPNAPELLHFLFTPLTVILDACHWGLGRNVAEQVISPLLSLDACELLRNCLTSKECDVWMALGKAWRTPPEDWLGVLPAPYRPMFSDGFAPYGFPQQQFESVPAQAIYQPHQRFSSAPAPIHRGVSASVSQPHRGHYGTTIDTPLQSRPTPYRERSVDNLNLERINLEKERLEFERMKVLDREQQLLEQEKRLRQEEARLEAERRLLHKEAEKHSIAGSDRPDFYRRDNSMQASPYMNRRTESVQVLSNGHVSGTLPATATLGNSSSNYASPRAVSASTNALPISIPDQSPRQKAFLAELLNRRCKIVQVTYDRVAQNPKELTVARGEYLEVLNDAKNWWECRGVHHRIGYVPHTILSVISPDSVQSEDRQQQPISPRSGTRGGIVSSSATASDDGTPEYIKERRGKNGEFRYF